MNENEYCFVSKDLLLFFRWICDNKLDLLEKLIKDSYEGGFKDELLQTEKNDFDDKVLQEAIVEFFIALENFIEKEDGLRGKRSVGLLSDEEDSGIALNFDFKSNIVDPSEDDNLLTKQKTFYSNENIYETLKKNIKEKKVTKEAFLSDFLKSWNAKNKAVH
jgi:hypothetical protein